MVRVQKISIQLLIQIWIFLFFFAGSPELHADGKVFPPHAFPANIAMPDQRALIQYSNGIERLVIETRFTGAGTNFAWVVPLPGQPTIEEATTGFFSTLQYLFQPQLIHSVAHYYWGFLAVIGFVLMVRFASKSVWNGFLVALLLLFLVGLFLPALGTAGSKSAGMASTADPAVSVLNRQIVGIFETTTIASHDPKALQVWLRENGFAQSTNSDSVITDYVKDGWIFVAAKIRRDIAELQTSTLHPLSFTFKTAKAVYPMRLTGVGNGPLKVELYVFGAERAKANHFKVERCTQPSYPNSPPNDPLHWSRWSPEIPNIVHPLLRKWVNGSAIATKLTATLSPADMLRDVWLDWTTFSEKQNHIFSRTGAFVTALNWGSGVFAGLLIFILLFSFFMKSARVRVSRSMSMAIIACVVLVGLIYSSLPKIEVRLVRMPGITSQNDLFYFHNFLLEDKPVTHAQLSAEARRLLANPTNDLQWGGGRIGGNNPLLGGRIREEDSPGNFILRENGDELEFVAYDAQGAEHVFGSSPLAKKP